MKLASTLCALLLLLAACKPGAEFVDATWERTNGDPVSTSTLSVDYGPEHCDWDLAVLLAIDWNALDRDSGPTAYVRNPGAVVPDGPAAPGPPTLQPGIDVLDVIPAGAAELDIRATDYRLYAPEDQSAMDVDGGGRIERWPALEDGCA